MMAGDSPPPNILCKDCPKVDPAGTGHLGEGWSRNIDATKDIGYPAREAGKYGSHPGHDGFDDESGSN